MKRQTVMAAGLCAFAFMVAAGLGACSRRQDDVASPETTATESVATEAVSEQPVESVTESAVENVETESEPEGWAEAAALWHQWCEGHDDVVQPADVEVFDSFLKSFGILPPENAQIDAMNEDLYYIYFVAENGLHLSLQADRGFMQGRVYYGLQTEEEEVLCEKYVDL